jgi:hypothetical protein
MDVSRDKRSPRTVFRQGHAKAPIFFKKITFTGHELNKLSGHYHGNMVSNLFLIQYGGGGAAASSSQR